MLWQLVVCFLPVSWGFAETLKERNIHLNISGFSAESNLCNICYQI